MTVVVVVVMVVVVEVVGSEGGEASRVRCLYAEAGYARDK